MSKPETKIKNLKEAGDCLFKALHSLLVVSPENEIDCLTAMKIVRAREQWLRTKKAN